MSSERPKIPVEPLSDARWAKIDDALFTALDARRSPEAGAPASGAAVTRAPSRYRMVGAASAVALAAAVLLFFVFRGSSPARNDMVLNPSHIETGATPSRLAVGESTVEVAPSSAVVASGDDAHGILVVVEKGQVDCEVTPRKDRPPFVVQAGNVRVRVVGTRFVVARDGATVHVSVAHGAVEVSRGAEMAMLHDGDTWPSATNGATGTNATSATSAGTAALTAPAPARSASTDDDATATARAPAAASTSAPSGAAPATIARDGTAQRLYEAAARTETSDPDGAMASYRRLAAGGGPWAPTALFAAGRLAADRGKTAEATRLLDDYLVRYPRGANVEDARRILARIR